MQKVPKPKRALYCSFCGKAQHEVRDLLAGVSVMGTSPGAGIRNFYS